MLEKYIGRSSFWPKWILLQYFFTDFDHKLQDPFLNKSQGTFFIQSAFQRLSLSITLSICNTLSINILEQYSFTQHRDGSRTRLTSIFVTFVTDWKPLSNVTKSFILDVAGALHMPPNDPQKQPWWPIPKRYKGAKLKATGFFKYVWPFVTTMH